MELARGKKWTYSNVTFQSCVQIVKPYSSTFKNHSVLPNAKKARVDRSLNNLVFCSEDGCTESFGDENSLTEHMLSGNHSYQPALAKSMTDPAKLSYINKMKHSGVSSSNHQLPLSSSISSTRAVIDDHHNLTTIPG